MLRRTRLAALTYSPPFGRRGIGAAGWVLILAIVVASPVAVRGALTQEEISSVMSLLETVAEREDHVGFAVAVSYDGEVVLDEARGMASLEYDVPATRDTRFIIMSVTKAFTGTAAYLSVRDGLIELDAPVSDYLSEAPFDMPPALTVRTLLTHTAGAPHFTHPGRRALYTQHFENARTALAAMEGAEFTHEPGEAAKYSSSNANILAAVIEAASGVRFEDYVAMNVLRPLELDRTEHYDNRKINRGLATNYSMFGIWDYEPNEIYQRVPNFDFSYNPGGGNMISTAGDLARFGGAFTREGFFDADDLAVLHRPISHPLNDGWGYGWAIERDEISGRLQMGITGATMGIAAGLVVFPEEGLSVAIVENSWVANARENNLVNTATGEFADRMLELLRR